VADWKAKDFGAVANNGRLLITLALIPSQIYFDVLLFFTLSTYFLDFFHRIIFKEKGNVLETGSVPVLR
jgi:hypothetical protein